MQQDMTKIGMEAGRDDMRKFPSILRTVSLLVIQYQPLLRRCFDSTGNKASPPLAQPLSLCVCRVPFLQRRSVTAEKGISERGE
jgi:hypothetical protein